ncbi:hypothetical protein [Paenarthrobacter sp. NEAU-H11]|uniref:hypothetical protein n=1 Tax=Paenarthrobacter sp. NEAU-H11 TaxID=3423924 RepID=UPI003D33EC2F
MTDVEALADQLVEAWEKWKEVEGPEGQGDDEGELLSTYIDTKYHAQEPNPGEEPIVLSDLIRLVFLLDDALMYSFQGGGHEIVLDAYKAAMRQLSRQLKEHKAVNAPPPEPGLF